MIIITSGRGNIDIDAYGGAIAYAYLLNLKGIEAIFSFNISDYAAIIIGFFYSIKDSYIFMFIFSISAYTNSILKLIYRNI